MSLNALHMKKQLMYQQEHKQRQKYMNMHVMDLLDATMRIQCKIVV